VKIKTVKAKKLPWLIRFTAAITEKNSIKNGIFGFSSIPQN
jgi:hypothetical protein